MDTTARYCSVIYGAGRLRATIRKVYEVLREVAVASGYTANVVTRTSDNGSNGWTNCNDWLAADRAVTRYINHGFRSIEIYQVMDGYKQIVFGWNMSIGIDIENEIITYAHGCKEVGIQTGGVR